MRTPTSVQEQIPETKAEKRSSCHPDKDEIRSREDVRHRGQEGKAREWVPGALEKREIWEMDGPDVSRARLTGGEGGPESVERRWGSAISGGSPSMSYPKSWAGLAGAKAPYQKMEYGWERSGGTWGRQIPPSCHPCAVGGQRRITGQAPVFASMPSLLAVCSRPSGVGTISLAGCSL